MAIRFFHPEVDELKREQARSEQAVCYSKTLWSKSRIFLRKMKQNYVPIKSKDGLVREFAWDDTSINVKKISADLNYLSRISERTLKTILDENGIEFIKIIGLDEIAWQFAKLLDRERIPFIVEGKRWDYFEHSFQTNSSAIDSIPDNKKLLLVFELITVQEKEPIAYGWIKKICDAYYDKLYARYVMSLRNKYGSNLKLVYFPNMEEVGEFATKNEIISFYRNIDVTRNNLCEWELQILRECVSKKEWKYYCDGIYAKGIKSVRDKVSDIHIEDIINITDGIRNTVGVNSKNRKTIYFVGTCELLSRRTDDAHTIPSYIQKYINQQNLDYNVVNYGAGSQSVLSRFQKLLELPYTMDVKIICSVWKNSKIPDEMIDCDVTILHHNREDDVAWYLNDPSHLLSNGNENIAKGIFACLIKDMIGECNEQDDTRLF